MASRQRSLQFARHSGNDRWRPRGQLLLVISPCEDFREIRTFFSEPVVTSVCVIPFAIISTATKTNTTMPIPRMVMMLVCFRFKKFLTIYEKEFSFVFLKRNWWNFLIKNYSFKNFQNFTFLIFKIFKKFHAELSRSTKFSQQGSLNEQHFLKLARTSAVLILRQAQYEF